MTHDHLTEEIKRRLGGEAVHGKFTVSGGKGEVVDPVSSIFPILKQLESGEWKLIGTGFFITVYGVIATAKHVVMDVIDENGAQIHPIAIVQFLPNDSYVFRGVLRWCVHACRHRNWRSRTDEGQ